MKKLYGSVIGIDQGSAQLFSDFDTNGPMWSASGERTRAKRVEFKEAFKSVPTVFVTLQMFDMHSETNQRAETLAADVDEAGFTVVFKTWGDTRIARASASWIAFGEARADDDWDIDYGS